MSQSLYNLRTAAVAEELRIQANEAMAAAFEQVDFIIVGHQPGSRVPGRSRDEQQRRRTSSTWAKSSHGRVVRVPQRALRDAPDERRSRRSCRARSSARARAVPRPAEHGRAHDHLEHLRQPRGVDPRRAPSTACRSACRCSPATTPTSCSSTSRSRSSGSGRGRWWRRAAAVLTTPSESAGVKAL